MRQGLNDFSTVKKGDRIIVKKEWHAGSKGFVEEVHHHDDGNPATVIVFIDQWIEKKRNGKPYQNPNRRILFALDELMFDKSSCE